MWRLKYLVWGKKSPRRFVFGVGLFTIGSFAYDWLKAPILHNQRGGLSLKARYGEGNYAVVTGAASPTGEAFCDKLTQQGFKVILVDDNERADVLKSMSEKYGAAPTFTFDFRKQTTW